MATGILIIGQSGTGKSTSLQTLDPKETFLINVVSKDLPFRGWKSKYTTYHKEENPTGNMYSTDVAGTIHKFLQYISTSRKEIKTIVVDDGQYIMANEYMRRAKETGFAKFVDISKGFFDLVNEIPKLREDLTVVLTFHADVETDSLGNKQIQAKTIGKMFNSYVTLEGLFTIVLYTAVKKTDSGLSYHFVTQNTGNNSGKSPAGMFETSEIPNDLRYVLEQVEAYNVG